MQGAHFDPLYIERVWEHRHAPTVEAAAHKLLDDKRVMGEWFDVTLDEAGEAVARAIYMVNVGKFRVFDQLALPLQRIQPRESQSPDWFSDPYIYRLIGYFNFGIRKVSACGDGMRHRLGYAVERDGTSVPAQQFWQASCGVHHHDIFVEGKPSGAFEFALRDTWNGDLFHIWSADTLPPGVTAHDAEAAIVERGASVIWRVKNDAQ